MVRRIPVPDVCLDAGTSCPIIHLCAFVLYICAYFYYTSAHSTPTTAAPSSVMGSGSVGPLDRAQPAGRHKPPGDRVVKHRCYVSRFPSRASRSPRSRPPQAQTRTRVDLTGIEPLTSSLRMRLRRLQRGRPRAHLGSALLRETPAS